MGYIQDMGEREIKPENKTVIFGPAGQLEAMVSGLFQTGSVHNIGIMCHPHPLYQGSMHNKVVTTTIRAWQQRAIATIRFNFRGVGESEGQYDHGVGECLDLQAVIDYAKAHYPNAALWLGGFSFGAFISLKVATSGVSPAGLISLAPALRFFNFLTLTLPECPWLVVQGTEDELVPKEEVTAWYDFLNKHKKTDLDWELLFIRESSHFFHGHLVELRAKIGVFMDRHLKLLD